jgi:hypothetical protein
MIYACQRYCIGSGCMLPVKEEVRWLPTWLIEACKNIIALMVMILN